MKKIMCFCCLLLLFAFKTSLSIFDLSFITPGGDEQPLSSYQGKRLMIIVLPVTQTPKDSSLLQLLEVLNNNYRDSVTMIGVPSNDDGYAVDSASSLMSWYRSYLDTSFIITGGMFTRKTSDNQAPLFSYLTLAEQNEYFNEDVYGPGEKFFINQEGRLYGISVPGADFNEEIFMQMIKQ